MKNGVFWDVTPRGYSKNRRFGVTYLFHHQGEKNRGVVISSQRAPVAYNC
jgi:hypothetical protein